MQVAIDVGIAEAAFEALCQQLKKAYQLSMRKLRKPVLNITPYKKSATRSPVRCRYLIAR